MGKFNFGEMLAKNPTPLRQERDIEVITHELLDLKRTAGESILKIGQCLIEAKAMLPHGEWLPWLTERAEFSERSAQYFMRIAREWTNPQSLADLGATKAFKLLVLPPDEREAFLSEPHEVNGQEKMVVDMSARELEKALKERDEARRQAEAAKADAEAAEQARAKMETDMKLLNGCLSATRNDLEVAETRVQQLEQELQEAENRPIEVAVEKVVDETEINRLRKELAEAQVQVADLTMALEDAKEEQPKPVPWIPLQWKSPDECPEDGQIVYAKIYVEDMELQEILMYQYGRWFFRRSKNPVEGVVKSWFPLPMD